MFFGGDPFMHAGHGGGGGGRQRGGSGRASGRGGGGGASVDTKLYETLGVRKRQNRHEFLCVR